MSGKTMKFLNRTTRKFTKDKNYYSYGGTSVFVKDKRFKATVDHFCSTPLFYSDRFISPSFNEIVKAANVLGKASRFAGKLSAYALPIEYLRQGFLRGKKQGFKIDPNQKSIIKEGKKKPINRKFSIYKR